MYFYTHHVRSTYLLARVEKTIRVKHKVADFIAIYRLRKVTT